MNFKAAVLVVVILVFVVTGCGVKPKANDTISATKTVGLLFEHDGVRIYRFYDAGEYHYFAVPRNGTFASAFSQWTETESCGKDCTTTVHYSSELPTIGAQ